jgi:hypothetical protein
VKRLRECQSDLERASDRVVGHVCQCVCQCVCMSESEFKISVENKEYDSNQW